MLQSDPHSGVTYPYYENPLAGGASPERDILPWLAGAAGAGVAAAFAPAWLLAIGGALALTRAATAGERGPARSAAAPSGGVFSTGASPLDTIGSGLNVDNTAGNSGSSASSSFGPQLGGASSIDTATRASTFADRFGNWGGTNGSVSAEPADLTKCRTLQHADQPRLRAFGASGRSTSPTRAVCSPRGMLRCHIYRPRNSTSGLAIGPSRPLAAANRSRASRSVRSRTNQATSFRHRSSTWMVQPIRARTPRSGFRAGYGRCFGSEG